ncbi:MAG: hypothetical protein H6709_11550 [Kofleriaceae bacterium]|nr:hypothetical protein [Kofleriaceae bacterium]
MTRGPADRLTWNLVGGRLDPSARASLAAHVVRWRGELPGYQLHVPAALDAVGVVGWGALDLDEPAPTRLISTAPAGSAARIVARVLDALTEIEQLVPGMQVTVLATTVAYRVGPLGFEPDPRGADERLVVEHPLDGWVPVADDDVAPAATGDGEPTPEELLATLQALPDVDATTRAPRHDRDEAPPRPGGPRTRKPARRAQADHALARELDDRMMTATVAIGIATLAALRDVPRDAEQEALYRQVLDAIGSAGGTVAAPTLALALAAGVPAAVATETWREDVCRALAGHPDTLRLLRGVADLPGFARIATAAAVRTAARAGDEAIVAAFLAHPFWKVRTAALPCLRNPDARARMVCSVWHGLDASDLPLDEHAWGYMSPLRVPAEGPHDWAAMAARFGGLVTLPPVASLADGVHAPCADQRAWCRATLAARGGDGGGDDGAPARDVLALDDDTRARLRAAEDAALRRAQPTLEALPAWLETHRPALEALVARERDDDPRS